MPIEEELQVVLNRYVAAYQVGDAEGCAAVFTDDGELHSPYGPSAVGRAAIAATHRLWTAGGSAGKRLDVIKAGGAGGLAWCLARFSEGAEPGTGTSLMVFQCQPGAEDWLIRICSLNETTAAEDATSR